MTKKFFKTYYSIPDKHNRVDVVFERGYRNIQVLYNGHEIATYSSAAQLMKSTAIDTPDESVVHIRFLKDTADFEVFFNAVQIDRSENSPFKVVKSLKWPVIACLAWYAFLIGLSIFRGNNIQFLLRQPSILIKDPFIFYIFTTSMVCSITLLISLFTLKRGFIFVYLLAIIVVLADGVWGISYPLIETFGASYSFDFTLLLIILPAALKTVMLFVFVSNLTAYRQFARDKAAIRRKTNPTLVDL